MPLIDPVTMSPTALAKMQPAAGDKETPIATLEPVKPYATPAAATVRHAHTAVLAASFLLSFGRLVEDPSRMMVANLFVVLPVQLAYASVCLPAYGSGPSVRKTRPGEKRKVEKTHSTAQAVQTGALVLIVTIMTIPLVHTLFVLFGAQFLAQIDRTALLSAHFSLLALLPLFHAHGVDAGAWRAIGGLMASLDEAYGSLLGGVLGCWLAAIPIPLDWDREWQKWPVTILTGLYVGVLVGKALGGTVLYGVRLARPIGEAAEGDKTKAA